MEVVTYRKPVRDYQNLRVEDLPLRTTGAQEIWETVRNSSCSDCVLGEGRSTKICSTLCLTGDGPVPAEAMVVAERPGASSDSLERPLYDQTGDLLDIALNDTGLTRDDIYITYAVKCRAPSTEDQDTYVQQAIKPCKPYLLQEIERVKPKTILIMGNAALKSLTGMSGITDKRGMEFYSEDLNAWIIVTVSPGYVRTRPDYWEAFYLDVQRFGRRVSGEEGSYKHPEVVTCSTVEQVREVLEKLAEVKDVVTTFDLETKAFADYRPDAKIWCVGLCNEPDTAYVIPLEHPESPFVIPPDLDGAEYSVQLAKKDEQIKKWLASPWESIATEELREIWRLLKEFFENIRVSGHNVKFDTRWMAQRGINIDMWFDTMLSSHTLNENRKVNLEAVSILELGATGWGKKKISFDPPEKLKEMIPYCGTDTANSHRIYLSHREKLFEDPDLSRLMSKVILPGARVYKKIELAGVWLDMERLGDRRKAAQEEVEDLEKALLQWVHEDMREQANFASPVFLSRWLFSPKPGGLGLPLTKKTKKREQYSTDEASLRRLKKKHPAVQALLDLRSAAKAVDYFDGWVVLLGPDGRLHPSFNMAGTSTGRRSCSDPNLQQVPRETTRKGVRSCLGSAPGWTFVACDYSQIEMVIAAWLAKEPTMLAIFNNGGDIHLYTAGLVTGKLKILQAEMGLEDLSIVELSAHRKFNERLAIIITKEERQLAKAVNFGFLYGMGARGFQKYALDKYDLEFSLPECEAFRTAYFELYPYLLVWHDNMAKQARLRQQVTSPVGRVRRLPMVVSTDWAIASKAERQAINSPVQGMVPDLILIALSILNEEPGMWIEARVIGDIHDEILLEIRDDMLDKWLPILKRIMENPPLEEWFGIDIPVKLRVDISTGRHWGETTEVEVAA